MGGSERNPPRRRREVAHVGNARDQFQDAATVRNLTEEIGVVFERRDYLG